uniref:EGF-like domain-containing protein n=1 Tax=Strigops habroptila TaxID=2489341 RepID=A0A672V7C6_STRHB
DWEFIHSPASGKERKSLFDKTPAPSEGKERKNYCRCQESTKSINMLNRGRPKDQLKPLAHNVSMKRNSSINSTKPTKAPRRAKRQDNYYEYSSFHPLHGPSQRDFDSFAYFFPQDYFEGVWMKLPLSWPTPNGITAAKALEICHQILANSTIGLVCKDLLGKQMNEAIDICLLDLQLKDDMASVRALIALLENECERRVLGIRNRVFHVENQEEILSVLRCPAFCNGNGQRTELGCQCFEDHSSYDCSIAKKQALAITGLENGRLCIVRASDCTRIQVFSLGFKESPNLHCEVTRLIVSSFPRAFKVLMIQLNFDMFILKSFTMKCISNDGFQFSNSRVLTLYDAVCQACQFHPTGLCKLKENTCNIDGLCYGEGESSPTSTCLLYNLPPVFQAPSRQLLTFIGENFVYQLIAVDPEGSAVLFVLEAGPQDARLSPAGLLIWKVDSEEMQTFEFAVSDECNVQRRYSIKVGVKPCRCFSGGTCATNIKFPPGLGEYLCLCPKGFDGEFCQEDINDCKSNPCGSGTCVDFCKCPPGLGEIHKIILYSHTAVCNPVCLNGGICVWPNMCTCPYGFYGPQCQRAVCIPPCKDGGHCVQTNVCSCTKGYTGRRCQKSYKLPFAFQCSLTHKQFFSFSYMFNRIFSLDLYHDLLYFYQTT